MTTTTAYNTPVGDLTADDRPTMPALTVSGVSHSYQDQPAVSDVLLDLHPGEVVCLLGPSGCGKSTLLRLVAGLEELQQGEILIDGERVAGNGHQQPPERRNVGLAFQDSALFPHLNVMDNVGFGLRHLPTAARRARGAELLERLGMTGYGDTYPHHLSGGQQQRVALARALAPTPRVMLLDEPFSSLDSRLRDQIRDDTLHVLKSVGTATLLVTHDPEEAMFMADRIFLMREGRIMQSGTPVELYCHPQDPFVVSFFGAVNDLEGRVENGEVRTPAGAVPAPGLEEGAKARVMIRPEALRVETRSGSALVGHDSSHVLMARLLGANSLLHLCLHDPETNEEAHMHARVPGVFLPDAGQPVGISLDLSQAFVFPA